MLTTTQGTSPLQETTARPDPGPRQTSAHPDITAASQTTLLSVRADITVPKGALLPSGMRFSMTLRSQRLGTPQPVARLVLMTVLNCTSGLSTHNNTPSISGVRAWALDTLPSIVWSLLVGG